MNILIINHYAGNRILGMVYRHYYLAKEWVKSGNKVMIVGGSFSHLRRQQPTVNVETIDGIEFRWIPVSTYRGSGLGRVKAMFDFVSKLWFNYKKYLGSFTPDVVISSSTYNLEIFPAKRIAKHYKAKLIYEVRDIWPLTPMELGGYSKYHPFIILLQAAEDYCYRNADKVVSLLPNALDHMVERGMDPSKFVYIPNGFDPEEWRDIITPQNNNPNFTKPVNNVKNKADEDVISNLQKLKKNGKFIIGFAGAHGIANSLYSVIDAVAGLETTDIILALVGTGNEKDNLKNYVKNKGIKNVFFFSPVTKWAIPMVLTQMDCLYIGLQKQPLFRFGISPNKMFDYMMAAKPVIQAIEAGNNMVKEAQNGIAVEPDNIEEIRNSILKIRKMDSTARLKLGTNGRTYALQKHAYPILAAKFIDEVSKA